MSNDQGAAPGPSTEVRLADVQQQTLEALKRALAEGRSEDAHCLAGTYETLVHAETMEHHAVRAHVERALKQLDEARARAPASANAAVPPAALETA